MKILPAVLLIASQPWLFTRLSAAPGESGELIRVQNPSAPAVSSPTPAPSAPPAADAAPLPVSVPPSDPALTYSGRFKKGKEGPSCQWPASAVTLRFEGSGLNVLLTDNNGHDFWQIVLDGKPADKLALQKGAHTYKVASGLSPGAHTVRLVKATESFFGVTRVNGFELSAGGHPLPAEVLPHRIEVIGDSISCGYGIEAASGQDHFEPGTESAWLGYGAVAARLLNADYTCIAWSGRKLWPDKTIVEFYDRTLPTEPMDNWDFKSAPAPEVVVITLGTNDINKGATDKDGDGWTAAYKAFIERVRHNYPGVTVYCASSPMLADYGTVKKRTLLHGWLAKITDDLTAGGDKKIHFLDFPQQDAKNGLGADRHPSIKTQELMGQQLAETIHKDLGW